MADNVTTATAAQQMQATIVSIDTSTNPAVTKINSKLNASKKYILETTQKKITPAINELNKSQKTLTTSLNASVKSVFDLVGNTSSDPELKARFEECVKSLSDVTDATVLNAIMNLLQRINSTEKKTNDNTRNITTISDNIKNILNETLSKHNDTYNIDSQSQDVFILSHIPVGPICFYIDGIKYPEEYLEYDAENNSIQWIGTDSNIGEGNGIDICDCIVQISYMYSIKQESDMVTQLSGQSFVANTPSTTIEIDSKIEPIDVGANVYEPDLIDATVFTINAAV